MAKDNFTPRVKNRKVKTKIVEGAPVKITRAHSGSLGKDIEEELIEKPEEGDWFDYNKLDGQLAQGPPSDYGRWVERIGNPLAQINKTEDVSQLPEMLTNEFPEVREAAGKKLRALENEKETSESRFDIIDIPNEEGE